MSTDFQENNYTIEELNLPISISHVISKGEDCSDLHIHSDQYEIYVFLRGDIDYFAGNIRKHLVRGDALIVSPNELHRPYLIKETAYERVIIHVNQDVIKKLSTPVSNIYRFLEQYNCCFFHLPDFMYKASIMTLTMELAGEAQPMINRFAFGSFDKIHVSGTLTRKVVIRFCAIL